MATIADRQDTSQKRVREHWKLGRRIRTQIEKSARRPKSARKPPLTKWIKENNAWLQRTVPDATAPQIASFVRLANRVEEDELNKLLALGHDGKGRLLVEKHLIALLSIEKDRLKVGEYASRHHLSPVDLTAHCRELRRASIGKSDRANVGRKPKPIPNLKTGLLRARYQARYLVKLLELLTPHLRKERKKSAVASLIEAVNVGVQELH